MKSLLNSLVFLVSLELSQGFTIDRRTLRRTSSPPSSSLFIKPASPPGSPLHSNRPSSQASNWYQRRKSGTVRTFRSGSGKKPPKWEKEGDELYLEILLSTTASTSKSQYHQLLDETISYEQARTLLQNATAANEKVKTAEKSNVMSQRNDTTTTTTLTTMGNSDLPFLWGGLSVGPVWKSRLVQAGYTLPTPVQYDAYNLLARSKQPPPPNVIIASPTGSGKSLAFLVPLLTLDKKVPGLVWIVTPTTELAQQLQAVVQKLSVGSKQELCQVLQQPAATTTTTATDSSDEQEDSVSLAATIGEAPILIGTPKIFLQLSKELRRPSTNPRIFKKCRELQSNLHTIVLDEADRLLQTEAVARQDHLRRQLKEQQQQQQSSTRKRISKVDQQNLKRLETTTTEQFLQRMLCVRSSTRPIQQQQQQQQQEQPKQRRPSIRLVCASATVGRTLRRQVMDLVNAPSMDAAAVLVTDRIRTKKDAAARKTSLLPDALKHQYYVMQGQEPGKDTMPIMLQTVSKLITSLPPAPMLIFPGRTGVRTLQQHLRDTTDLAHVGGLEDIPLSSSALESDTIGNDAIFQSWRDAPVYVVSEKLGRGLDIVGLRYVLLLQIPSSAAGYTHLTGRTGRNGSPGTAICMCPPRQAPKLCIIAETLGLCMEELLVPDTTTAAEELVNSTISIEDDDQRSKQIENDVASVKSQSGAIKDDGDWSKVSSSALRRKAIPEMKAYLIEKGVSLSEKMKKADLLEAVNELHERRG